MQSIWRPREAICDAELDNCHIKVFILYLNLFYTWELVRGGGGRSLYLRVVLERSMRAKACMTPAKTLFDMEVCSRIVTPMRFKESFVRFVFPAP